MEYDNKEAVSLAYLIIKNVEKDLGSIMESVLKELEIKGDDQMKTFVSIL